MQEYSYLKYLKNLLYKKKHTKSLLKSSEAKCKLPIFSTPLK